MSNLLKNFRSPWFAALAVVFVYFFFVFRKTLLHRANISVLSHVLNMDSAFNPGLPDEIEVIAYDPTPYTLLVPYQAMLKACVLSGHMPFWNDLSGCGSPLLGDFNALVFSPITWTLAFCRHSTYLLTQCVLVLLGAVGALLLARRLGLNPIPAIFAGIFFGFNPSIARYVELPNNHFLTPFLVLLVLNFAARSFWRSVAAGVVCGLTVYVMHAEVSFGAVMMAWLFLLICGVLEMRNLRMEFIISYFRSLLIGGISGILVAAPVLLPFLEFSLNSSCYKDFVDWSRYVPIQAMLLNLVNPCNAGESFFGGIVLLPLAFLGWFKRGRWVKTLGVVAILNLWLVCKIPPLDAILSSRPLNFFMPAYASPSLVLFLVLLAAFGVQTLMETKPKHILTASFLLLVCATTPYLLAINNVRMETWQFDANHVIVQLEEVYFQGLLAFLAALLMLASVGQANTAKQRLLALAVIAVNMWSMSSALRLSLPISQSFWFPKTDMIAFMQEHPGRFVAVGPHLLIPNIAAIYGLDDFRSTNPFHLQRYYRYLMQAGAQRAGLQSFTFEAGKLGKELDIASVKYVIAQAPHDRNLSPDRFKLIKSFDGSMRLYENTEALPMAYLAHSWQTVHSQAEALKLMRSDSFDASEQIVIESEEQLCPERKWKRNQLSLPARSSAKQERKAQQVRRISPMKLELRVSNPKDGILVLNHTYYPGWVATVDHKETKILPVNGMFRGLIVPAGEHEVVFEYKPQSFRYGLLLTGAGILMLSTIAFALRRQKKVVGAQPEQACKCV